VFNVNDDHVAVSIVPSNKRSTSEQTKILAIVLTPYSTINNSTITTTSVTTALSSSATFKKALDNNSVTLKAIAVSVTPVASQEQSATGIMIIPFICPLLILVSASILL